MKLRRGIANGHQLRDRLRQLGVEDVSWHGGIGIWGLAATGRDIHESRSDYVGRLFGLDVDVLIDESHDGRGPPLPNIHTPFGWAVWQHWTAQERDRLQPEIDAAIEAHEAERQARQKAQEARTRAMLASSRAARAKAPLRNQPPPEGSQP